MLCFLHSSAVLMFVLSDSKTTLDFSADVNLLDFMMICPPLRLEKSMLTSGPTIEGSRPIQ